MLLLDPIATFHFSKRSQHLSLDIIDTDVHAEHENVVGEIDDFAFDLGHALGFAGIAAPVLLDQIHQEPSFGIQCQYFQCQLASLTTKCQCQEVLAILTLQAIARAPLKISEGSGDDGPAIGCTVGSPLIEVGSVVEN
jgi:hypothetical protein